MILPRIITSTDGKDNSTELISYNLIKNRTIFLYGEINSEAAVSIVTQLVYLDAKSNADIYLVINSPGGSVSDGLSIYDCIKALRSDVCTIATGMAASMGSFLLAAGAKGKRYATPTSEIMIHQPLGGVEGQATDISLVAEHITGVKCKLASILADECGKDVNDIMADMERDYWLSSERAKDYGLVDEVGYPPEWV